MPSVVSNSTPIIALAKTRRLDVMKSLYGEVLIPEAVFREVAAKDDVAACAVASSSDWLVTRDAPKPDTASLLRTRLYAGEVEAIMLAREIGAELVVIDDAAQRTKSKLRQRISKPWRTLRASFARGPIYGFLALLGSAPNPMTPRRLGVFRCIRGLKAADPDTGHQD